MTEKKKKEEIKCHWCRDEIDITKGIWLTLTIHTTEDKQTDILHFCRPFHFYQHVLKASRIAMAEAVKKVLAGGEETDA